MAKFAEAADYFNPGLEVTVLGRDYRLPLPSAELGLWCTMVAQMAPDALGAATAAELHAVVDRVEKIPPPPGMADGRTLTQLILGDVYDAMVERGVPHHYIEFVGQTGFFWIVGGEPAAERYWTAGGRPQSVSPANRTERRAAKAASSSRTTSTAAAPTTRKRASGSGTSSPKTGSTAARRSRGSSS